MSGLVGALLHEDMIRLLPVSIWVLLVQEYEDEVEPGQQARNDARVLANVAVWVPLLRLERVRGCDDGCPRVDPADNASLGHANRLLLHRLMDA